MNLEKKNTTAGAQVDFRGGLKQTGGKGGVNVKLPFSVGRSDAGKSEKPAEPETKSEEEPVSEKPVEPAEQPAEPEQEQEPEAKPTEPEAKPAEPEPESVKQEEAPKPKAEPPKSKFDAESKFEAKSKFEPKSKFEHKSKFEPKFQPQKQKVSPFGPKIGDKGGSKPAPKGLADNKYMPNTEPAPAAPAKQPEPG